MDKPEYSRVDVQITVNPHTDPEEETKLVLQQFLLELQKYDSKVAFAPWNETSMLESWSEPAMISARTSELECFFPVSFV
mmetsp:Transcript_177/g.263  ORF Transcript_177/g.263 Transcript_177/m.263 type:complete len:80 (-) Transcript_177:472-711(-)